MLYSIELGSRNIFLFLGGFGLLGVVALLDAGLLAGEIAEVEDACATNFTELVDSNAVDEGRLIREDPLDSDSAGNLTDGEGPGVRSSSADLDDHAAEVLLAELVAFLDLVGNGDGVTGLELREVGYILVRECFVYYVK